MIVCTRCGGLAGPNPHNRDHVQRCYCPSSAPPPIWPGHDFARHSELCGLCASTVIPSGSRWSSLLCDECRGTAHTINMAAGTAIIPVGRHSLAHARYLRNATSTSALPNILGGLRAALDDLRTWRALIVADRYPAVDEVALDRYLERCRGLSEPRTSLAERFVIYRGRVTA
jgi:hypothetical protein